MRIDPETLAAYAVEARRVSRQMEALAEHLDMAAVDAISQADIDLTGAYSASNFARERLPILERL